jgi:anti-anti-sigma regulatory factor
MTLRIQRSIEGDQVVFHLAGRIRGDQVAELRALLNSAVSDQKLLLDLKGVKLIHRDVVRFLTQIEAEGASLRNCSAFIREWILQERIAMRRAEAEHPEAQRD